MGKHLLYTAFSLFIFTIAGAQKPVTVFNYDLTRGKKVMTNATVEGGIWSNGWSTSGEENERIVFDPGYYIKNGILEVSFAASEKPWIYTKGKINYAGLYQEASLDQDVNNSDIFYARTGSPVYRFSNVKAAGRRFDRSEYEPRLGDTTDWFTDNNTIHTIKFEWRDGVPVFHDSKGRKTIFPRDIIGSDTPIDSLRYVFIGSDKYTGLTVKGLRFTRVKLTDLGPDIDSPEPPGLMVHSNGRNLVDENGKPVFLICETAWGLVRSLNREDIDFYLRTRRSQRFNAVAFVCMNPPNSRNFYGKKAFKEIYGRADVNFPLITKGNNYSDTSQYDYWDHLDYALERITKLGMYAVALPAWGTAVSGTDNGNPPKEGFVINKNNAYAYGRFLGERYRSFKNIIWMLGGDVAAIYGENDFRDVYRILAEGIADGVKASGTFDGKADYSGILMSFHSAKLQPQSSDWFHNDEWLSFNSIQNWPELLLPSIEKDLRTDPRKPTWIFEGRYEGYHRFNYTPELWKDWQIRQQAWQTAFKGTMGFTYGHEMVFGFGKNDVNWKEYIHSEGSQSMKHFAKFMNYVDPGNILNIVSDDLLINGNEGFAGRLSSDLIICGRNVNGGFAMFYSAVGRSITVRLSNFKSDSPLFAWIYNPRTGCWFAEGIEAPNSRPFMKQIKCGPGTPDFTFDFPGEPSFGSDWVLVLSQREWF